MSNDKLTEKNTVVFHPGIGKTGTSAIQKVGFSLPSNNPAQVCFVPIGQASGAHNALAMNHPQFDSFNFESNIQKIIQFETERNTSTIISSEFLIRLTKPQIVETTKALMSAGVQVKAIFSIRDYSTYLASAYMQAIKAKFGRTENEGLLEYCSREIESIRYPILLDRWAKVIGDQNIYLLDYDLYRESFVTKFFSVFNIGLNERIKLDNKNVNPSIPLCFDEVMIAFDRVSNNVKDRKELIQLLVNAEINKSLNQKRLQEVEKITLNKFKHDKERLTVRYSWVGDTPLQAGESH